MIHNSRAKFPLQDIICSFHQSWQTMIGFSYPYLFLCCITSSLIYFIWFKTIIMPQYSKYRHFMSQYKHWTKRHNEDNDIDGDKTLLLKQFIFNYSSIDTQDTDHEIAATMCEYDQQFMFAKARFYNAILNTNRYLNPDLLDTIFDFSMKNTYDMPWNNLVMESLHARYTTTVSALLIIYPLSKLVLCSVLCGLIFYEYAQWYPQHKLNDWTTYKSILYCLLYLQPYVHSWNIMMYIVTVVLNNPRRTSDMNIWAIWYNDDDIERCKGFRLYKYIAIVHLATTLVYWLFYCTFFVHIFYLVIIAGGPVLLLLWGCTRCFIYHHCPVTASVVAKCGAIICVYSIMADFPTIFMNYFWGFQDIINWNECDYIWDVQNLDIVTKMVVLSWVVF
eukprot:378315_1